MVEGPNMLNCGSLKNARNRSDARSMPAHSAHVFNRGMRDGVAAPPRVSIPPKPEKNGMKFIQEIRLLVEATDQLIKTCAAHWPLTLTFMLISVAVLWRLG
jgi:hypothetical protein